MKRAVLTLRRLRDCNLGSLPLQYAIIASATAIATLMIVQTASSKVADKLNAVTAALTKIQF
jgi:hypothetical protein